MPRTIHAINGMTSQDCANFVGTELSRLPGVTDVRVDLAVGHRTSSRGSWGPFVRHYLEMVVAMIVGMVVLGPLVHLAVRGLGLSDLFGRSDVSSIMMATNMTIGMSLWMRFRRHSWASIAEMGAAMYIPFLALLIPYWAGLLSGSTLMTAGHVLMLPLMAIAMLRRRDEYTGHHRHAHETA